jgi:hypothetical protein
VTDSAEKWIEDENFREIVGKAGSIGALVSIGIAIYVKYKNEFKKPNEKAFGSLLKIVLESAKETLRDSDYIIHEKDIRIKEDLLVGLFEIFRKEEFEWNSYLPDHPVLVTFRERLSRLLLESDQPLDKVRRFIFDFNVLLEERATSDKSVAQFYRWWTPKKHSEELVKYLIFTQSWKDYPNPVDKKPLSAYYVENRSFLLDTETWNKDYKKIPSNSQKWDINEDLLKNNDKWYTVIGAPFGIGKTSLAMSIASKYALEYLRNPNSSQSYIPVFVPLRHQLNGVYQQRHLDNVLGLIAPEGEGKKRKILLICDGLDEYGKDEQDVSLLYNKLSKYKSDYPNLKTIITTRLRAGWTRLFTIDNYVRLFPFDKFQVNQFFKNYGLKGIKYEDIKMYGLRDEEVGKPLFCWMFAIMNSETDEKVDFDESWSPHLHRALIYQKFVHSVIRGKHEKIARSYEWDRFYRDEKKILRRIAALRQLNKGSLTVGLVDAGLKAFGVEVSDVNVKEKIIEPIITSYFYLQSNTSNEEQIDFIHKSFEEYLVAEYYIESIINKDKWYRLSIGTPSNETMVFFDGLLELFNLDNAFITGYLSRFIDSLPDEETKELFKNKTIDEIKEIIITNVQTAFQEVQVVFQSRIDSEELWNIARITIQQFSDLWIHKWLLARVLNKFGKMNSHSKSIFKLLVEKTVNNIPTSLKKLERTHLDHINLSGANLQGANLEGAFLNSTDMIGANLCLANLEGANLEYAPLRYALLNHTQLMRANLRHADLQGASLVDANLVGAIDRWGNQFNRRANKLTVYSYDKDFENKYFEYHKEGTATPHTQLRDDNINKITKYTSDGKPSKKQG